MNWQAITAECVATLSRMIQFDTVNPPGNEMALLQWLQELLRRDGIDAVLLESAPGRGNLVARVRARGPATAGPLLLLTHVDVVPVVPSEWQHPPFSGAVVNGEVWGRGALDMKGTAATWVTILQQIQRTGLATSRDVILAATADEEAGGYMGAKWLVENHWDLVACDAGLNEGGGEPITLGGVTYFTYQVAEKAGCRFKLVARGTGGHASVPLADNAVIHLARAVAAVGETLAPVLITDPFRAFVEGLAAAQPPEVARALLQVLEPGSTDAAIHAAPLDEFQRAMLRSMCRTSMAPTILNAGSVINVIPAAAEARVDCRILPGQTVAEVLAMVEGILARAGLADKVAVEPIMPRPAPPASPLEHPLVDAIRQAMAKHAPGAPVIPAMTTGATDSRYFRPRGVPMYGFTPLLPGRDDERTVHSRDERIAVDSLEFRLKVIWDVVATFCTGAPAAPTGG